MMQEYIKPKDIHDIDVDVCEGVNEYLYGDSYVRMRYDHYLEEPATKLNMSPYYYRAGIRPFITAHDKWLRLLGKYEDLYEEYKDAYDNFDNFSPNPISECRRIQKMEERLVNMENKLERYKAEVIESVKQCTAPLNP